MNDKNSCNCGCNQSKSNTLKNETEQNTPSGCCHKSAECNEWTSGSANYNIKDSCEKNEKSAGNNQWCSTSK